MQKNGVKVIVLKSIALCSTDNPGSRWNVGGYQKVIGDVKNLPRNLLESCILQNLTLCLWVNKTHLLKSLPSVIRHRLKHSPQPHNLQLQPILNDSLSCLFLHLYLIACLVIKGISRKNVTMISENKDIIMYSDYVMILK